MKARQPRYCGDVVLNHCRRCAGLWIDEGTFCHFRDALERPLLERRTVRAHATIGVHATMLPCPHCRRWLVLGELAYGTGVHLVRCAHRNGLSLPGNVVTRFIEHV